MLINDAHIAQLLAAIMSTVEETLMALVKFLDSIFPGESWIPVSLEFIRIVEVCRSISSTLNFTGDD
jgi:hypothetical protein